LAGKGREEQIRGKEEGEVKEGRREDPTYS